MKKKILLILKIFFIILLIISIIGLFSWFNDNKKVKKINEKIDDYLEIKDDQYKLKADLDYLNKDTVGWIIIKGTNINYPIVQGKDNNCFLYLSLLLRGNSVCKGIILLLYTILHLFIFNITNFS